MGKPSYTKQCKSALMLARSIAERVTIKDRQNPNTVREKLREQQEQTSFGLNGIQLQAQNVKTLAKE